MYILDINMDIRELKHVRGEGKRSQLFGESFLARCETLGPLFHTGTLLGLSLCGSYVCKLTVSVSCICTLAPLCLDDAVFF